jgi:hypothetical protein
LLFINQSVEGGVEPSPEMYCGLILNVPQTTDSIENNCCVSGVSSIGMMFIPDFIKICQVFTVTWLNFDGR